MYFELRKVEKLNEAGSFTKITKFVFLALKNLSLKLDTFLV